MSELRYSTRTGSCAVLGPGDRAVLWVYGCCFSCKGCIGENFRSGGKYRETTAEEAAAWYLRQNADGLTVSGGEPMLQAAALSEMIEEIRRQKDCGVIVYTGFVYEDLLRAPPPGADRLLRQTDLLIDGPYIQELDHGQPYRGSDNQRLIPLTERYREDLQNYYAAAQARKIELHLTKRETLMAGVPGREQAEIWQKLKKLGDKNGADHDG